MRETPNPKLLAAASAALAVAGYYCWLQRLWLRSSTGAHPGGSDQPHTVGMDWAVGLDGRGRLTETLGSG